MNLSCAIMLVNDSVRPVRVSYDPDVPKNNNLYRLFKTLDPDIKKDDYVIVPTNTRHGYTAVKVEEVDFIVNYDGGEQWDWIVGKVDKDAHDKLKEQEGVVLNRIGKAEENRKKDELRKALGLADVELTDLEIVKGTVALPQPSTPRGAGNTADGEPMPAEAPAPETPAS
jgi:hypothetical protein